MSATPRITRHAVERGIERLSHRSASGTRGLLSDLYATSIPLPRRFANQLLGKRHRKRKGGARYRVAGSTLLVCRGRLVITTWALSDEQSATVLWWALTGQFKEVAA